VRTSAVRWEQPKNPSIKGRGQNSQELVTIPISVCYAAAHLRLSVDFRFVSQYQSLNCVDDLKRNCSKLILVTQNY